MAEDSASDDRTTWWNETYRDEEELPWDTGSPQSAVVALAEAGEIAGRVLDVGCGVGTESFYLAERGHEVVGVDFAAEAIDRARDRRRDRSTGGSPTFEVADALALRGCDLGTFDTVLDVGTFHTLETSDYADYAASVGSVLRTGGRVVLVEFGVDAPEDWGPDPVAETDVRDAFGEGWTVETVEATAFETRSGAVPGIRAAVERTAD